MSSAIAVGVGAALLADAYASKHERNDVDAAGGRRIAVRRFHERMFCWNAQNENRNRCSAIMLAFGKVPSKSPQVEDGLRPPGRDACHADRAITLREPKDLKASSARPTVRWTSGIMLDLMSAETSIYPLSGASECEGNVSSHDATLRQWELSHYSHSAHPLSAGQS